MVPERSKSTLKYSSSFKLFASLKLFYDLRFLLGRATLFSVARLDTHPRYSSSIWGENMRKITFNPTPSQCDREFFLMAQQLRVRLEPNKRLTSDQAEGNDFRRRYRRTVRSISGSVQPLDDDFQPCGGTFWVVSRDVSMHGMGLISHEPFGQRFVRLGLMEQSVTTIAEVRHNTAIGGKYPLFLVGVSFEGKLLDSNGNLNPS